MLESNGSHVRGDTGTQAGQTWNSRGEKTKLQFAVVAPRLQASQLPLLLINILTALQRDRFQRVDSKPYHKYQISQGSQTRQQSQQVILWEAHGPTPALGDSDSGAERCPQAKEERSPGTSVLGTLL